MNAGFSWVGKKNKAWLWIVNGSESFTRRSCRVSCWVYLAFRFCSTSAWWPSSKKKIPHSPCRPDGLYVQLTMMFHSWALRLEFLYFFCRPKKVPKKAFRLRCLAGENVPCGARNKLAGVFGLKSTHRLARTVFRAVPARLLFPFSAIHQGRSWKWTPPSTFPP